MKKVVLIVVLIATLLLVQGAANDSPNRSLPMGPDPLMNTSRLSDAQLRLAFEAQQEHLLGRVLDRDRDGLADYTGVELWEFVFRMKLILSDRMPFDYNKANVSARDLDFLNPLLSDLLDT